MLFDYRKQTDVVSREGIISWLETKDPDQEYVFSDCKGMCLYSQYLTDRLGEPADRPHRLSGEARKFWDELHLKFWDVAGCLPYTFGAALKRARDPSVGPSTALTRGRRRIVGVW